MSWPLLHGSLLMVMFLTCPVWADAVVTNCSSGTQPGAGLNLAQAVTYGGRITFQCADPNASVIPIEQPIAIIGTITIDGENNVTLGVWDRPPLFTVAGRRRQITLSNLRIWAVPNRDCTSPSTSNCPPSPRSPVGAIAMGDMDVVLEHVIVENVVQPIRLDHGSATISDSEFRGGTGPLVRGPNVTINRTTINRPVGDALAAWGMVTLDNVSVFGSGTDSDLPSTFDNCRLTISNSLFTGVRSQAPQGGAIRSGCDTEVHHSRFISNGATKGGAIFVGAAAPRIVIQSAVFEENVASSEGGAVAFEPSWEGRQLEILWSHFRRNVANGSGGAISLVGQPPTPTLLQLNAVSFKQNHAVQRGGAIAAENASLVIGRSLFLENEAGSGSAISMIAPQGIQSIVAANLIAAGGVSPGAAALELAGGMILNSTIVANKGVGLRASRQTRLSNTVVSRNTEKNCFGTGQIVDGGANSQFPDATCGAWPIVDPKLDNFFIPALDSQLLNAGNDQVCGSEWVAAKDFYGARRPRLQHCSIGAVEGDIQHLFNVPPAIRARAREQRFTFP